MNDIKEVPKGVVPRNGYKAIDLEKLMGQDKAFKKHSLRTVVEWHKDHFDDQFFGQLSLEQLFNLCAGIGSGDYFNEVQSHLDEKAKNMEDFKGISDAFARASEDATFRREYYDSAKKLFDAALEEEKKRDPTFEDHFDRSKLPFKSKLPPPPGEEKRKLAPREKLWVVAVDKENDYLLENGKLVLKEVKIPSTKEHLRSVIEAGWESCQKESTPEGKVAHMLGACLVMTFQHYAGKRYVNQISDRDVAKIKLTEALPGSLKQYQDRVTEKDIRDQTERKEGPERSGPGNIVDRSPEVPAGTTEIRSDASLPFHAWTMSWSIMGKEHVVRVEDMVNNAAQRQALREHMKAKYGDKLDEVWKGVTVDMNSGSITAGSDDPKTRCDQMIMGAIHVRENSPRLPDYLSAKVNGKTLEGIKLREPRRMPDPRDFNLNVEHRKTQLRGGFGD
jgi:hypothetical protein